MTTPRINLLSDALVRRTEHLRQARRWTPVVLAVAGLLCAGQIGLQIRSREATNAMTLLNARLEDLHRWEQEISQLQAEAKTTRKLLGRYDDLAQADVPLALIQVVAEACNKQLGKLQIDSYRMEESSAAAPAQEPRFAPGKRLIITGSAETAVDVSHFVGELRGFGVFDAVVLEASQASGAESDSRTFQVRCEMNDSESPQPSRPSSSLES